uniref:Uncharacterized protein n=1 Tax=Ditylenchus dipsaci TaxID=166011 RepID=A0A915DPK4_9BILA
MVRDLFQKHVLIKDKLDGYMREEFEEIRNTGGDSMQIPSAIEFLAQALKTAEPGKNVLFQMDNFDSPLLTILDFTYNKYSTNKQSAIRLWNSCHSYMTQLITKIML